MSVILQQVVRPSRDESPFDQSDPRFHRSWWIIPPGPYRDTSHDWYIVMDGSDEVARVEVNNARMVYAEDYRGWPRDEQVAEITFIEVRPDLRGRGFGTETANEIVHRYLGRVLAAHPKNSDGFWESLGWHRHDNVNQPRLAPPLYSSL